MQERTALFLRVLDPEQQPQHAAQRLRRPPHHDLHSLHLLRMQPQPQTMRSKATKNIKNPTGKIATMKIASPSASAQMPRQFHFLPHMAAPPSVRLMLHQYIRRGPVPCARQEKSRTLRPAAGRAYTGKARSLFTFCRLSRSGRSRRSSSRFFSLCATQGLRTRRRRRAATNQTRSYEQPSEHGVGCESCEPRDRALQHDHTKCLERGAKLASDGGDGGDAGRVEQRKDEEADR